MVAKFDSISGAQLWMYTFGGTDQDYINGVTVSNDGMILYAVGMQQSMSHGSGDYAFIAFSTTGSGTLLFYKTFGCELFDTFRASVSSPD